MTKTFKKTIAAILAIVLFAAIIPTVAFGTNAQNEQIWVDKKVDPSTMDSWQEMFPSDNTIQAGGVWTDKSVFTNADEFKNLKDVLGNNASIKMLDETNNFLVALSALASNKSIVGYSYTPTDTMLVLDVSGSMANSNYVSQLVSSANDAIVRLLELNKHNRVGVVLYSGSTSYGNSQGNTAQVLLPLDRYTQSRSISFNRTETNVFLVDDDDRIEVNQGVKNSAGLSVSQSGKNVEGGTYIQNGVYMAMQELLKADVVIPENEIQAGTTRTPIVVLMSDGAPTTATSDFAGLNRNNNTVGIGTSNLGNGSAPGDVLDDVIDFVNQLTAVFAKQEISEHYNSTNALFYTLGLGANSAYLNSAVLNPSGFTNTDTYWKDYVALSDNSTIILEIEKANSGNGGYPGGNGGYPGGNSGNDNNTVDTTSIVKIAEINSVEQKNYVTKYFPAQNSNDLKTAFEEIVNQIIIQSLYYPTLVSENDHDHDGFVEFIDDIGHYMDVKDVKGLLIGDTLFTGELLAKNFCDDSSSFYDKDGNFSDFANGFVWSIKERLGINDIVEVRELVNNAYESKQLYYDEQTGEWSNFIGWYADDNGNYMGHWHEGHDEDDIPEINGVKATYINRSYGVLGAVADDYASTDLLYISTQVHTRISDGNCSFIWKIPASLIPVISYKVTLNAETLEDATSAEIEYDVEEPIRVVFEVGLFDKINKANLTEMMTDADKHIVDENGDNIADDGKYYFHTNWWKDADISHDNFSYTNDTIVFFEPSKENERYYYSETTPVLVYNGTDYVKYTGQKPGENDSNTYYRLYYVFNGNDVLREYEEMSAATLAKAVAGENNTWNIPAGTVHRTLEPYNERKTSNETQSIDYVRYPVVDEIPEEANNFYIGSILGNNGLMTVEIPQGIKLTKTVDDTLYATNETFEFKITAANVTGEKEAYKVDALGVWTEETVTFNVGEARALLKAGESLYILGIDETTFSVAEIINGNYSVKQIKVNGSVKANANAIEVVRDAITEVEFTNTLVVNDGTIVVSKEVVHDNNIAYNSDIEFEFELYKDGTLTQNFKIKAGETKTFEHLAEGEYTVKEINLPAGFTANESEITKTVVNGATAFAFRFVNTYSPEKVTNAAINVSGTKNISGRDWKDGDTFTFVLQQYLTNGWTSVAEREVAYNANGNYGYKFDFANDTDLLAITFDSVGKYYFRVIEQIPAASQKLGGMTYDENPRYFTVEVSDETMDGALEVKAVESSNAIVAQGAGVWNVTGADFTNAYMANNGDDITIIINKTVDNDKAETALTPEGYVFGIYTANNTLLATSEPTDANGNTSITLTFPASAAGKSYDLYVCEIVPENALAGMQYDTTPRPITITIIDNLNGTTTAVIGTAEGITQDYTNVYAPKDVTVSLEGTKVLEGRNFDANEFEFVLSGDGIADRKVGHASKVEYGKIDFGTLTFSKVGTYRYTVSETKGQLGGIDYSTKVYVVDIIVSDDANNDGTLDAVVKVDGKEVSGSTKAVIVFENIYQPAEATVTIEAIKNLIGRDITANDNFKFAIYSANSEFVKNNVIGYNKSFDIDAQNATKALVTFEQMTFATTGDWYFVVVEEGVNGKGITVDKTEYKVSVNVIDDLNGNLIATVKVDGKVISGSTKDAIVFNNTYEATASLTISATKKLDGRELKADEFTFELYNEQNQKIGEAKSKQDGTITFDPIIFTQTGDKTYNYTIKEVAGSDKAISYDTKTYALKVEAIDNGDGTLTLKTYVDTKLVSGLIEDEIVFNNKYEATASLTISATKKLDGRELKADEFTFELYNEQNQKIGEAKSKQDGTIMFDPIIFTQAGDKTYNYTIKEVAGSDKSISYDTKTYALKVEAIDNGDGTLTLKTYVDTKLVSGLIEDEIVFNNVYSTSGSFIIKAEKELVGRDLLAGEFEFELYDELGAKIETVKNDADGNISFASIQLNKAGKKVYTIKEVKGNAENVTYDDSVYLVEVTATDNGDGTLTITQKFFDANEDEITKIVFENMYKEPIKPPQTGDTVNPLLIAVAIISAVGLAVVVRNKKKEA